MLIENYTISSISCNVFCVNLMRKYSLRNTSQNLDSLIHKNKNTKHNKQDRVEGVLVYMQ